MTDRMPVPESGPLSGREGKMLLRGSAGRLAPEAEGSFTPTNERLNETGLDHFAGGGEIAD